MAGYKKAMVQILSIYPWPCLIMMLCYFRYDSGQTGTP